MSHQPTIFDDADEPGASFDFAVSELELYLDGELPADDAVAVRRRAAEDAAYAATLDRLHADRLDRAAAYDLIERGETEPAAADRVNAIARRLASRGRPGLPRWAKVVGGMAACVLVGFGMGYMGPFDTGPSPAVPNPTPYATPSGGGSLVSPVAGPPPDGWYYLKDGHRVTPTPVDAPQPPRPIDGSVIPLVEPTLQMTPR